MTYTVHAPHNQKIEISTFTNMKKAKDYARSIAKNGDTAIIHAKNNLGHRAGQQSCFKNSKGGLVWVEGA